MCEGERGAFSSSIEFLERDSFCSAQHGSILSLSLSLSLSLLLLLLRLRKAKAERASERSWGVLLFTIKHTYLSWCFFTYLRYIVLLLL